MPLATVFGGSGYLGQAAVRAFLAEGWTVRVAARHAAAASETPDGLTSIQADIRNPDQATRAVGGADCAVNAVSAYVETGDITYEEIHVRGAETLARACRDTGVSCLIQISGIGANPAAMSPYISARGRGEERVREVLPTATILRPSVLFSEDGGLVAALAGIVRSAPVIPLIGGGRTRLQPVHVEDVAAAVVRTARAGGDTGRVYELGGPQTLSLRQIFERVAAALGRHRAYLPLPFAVARAVAPFAERLPGAPLTRAQVELLMSNNLADPKLPGFAELGIQPRTLDSALASLSAARR